MKIGQGKSNKGIKPTFAVNEQETSKVNHPDNTSKPVKMHNMTAGAYRHDGNDKVNPPKNIQYTFEDLREGK